MNFISITFGIFILIFAAIYYIIPRRCRYIVLAIGSYIFYGIGNVSSIFVLALTTLITFAGGSILERKPYKKVYTLFLVMNLSILFFFKYVNLFTENVNFVLPIGLSFYVFQSTTYLGDVYRGEIKAEKNFIRYSAFTAFFPSILSGPIQKARILLPQIKEPADFNADRAIKGFILFVWGAFQKIVVANRLIVIVDTVFGNYLSFGRNSTAYFIVASVSFSIYIYADFSSYSDMARGIAKLLGIEVGRNFNNPYLSISCSEFWRRWHVSLNEWLTENVYIPMGGSRKGLLRKYLNILIVFLISGIWHGALWHFVIWGLINGIFVIIGQVLKPIKTRIYAAINVDENAESIVICRRIIVFGLITITWVFFNNGIRESLYIIKNILCFYPINFFVPEILTICGTEIQTFGTVLFVVIFSAIQYCRKEEGKYYCIFRRQPVLVQCMVLALIICMCIFKATGANVILNTEFMYFNF